MPLYFASLPSHLVYRAYSYCLACCLHFHTVRYMGSGTFTACISNPCLSTKLNTMRGMRPMKASRIHQLEDQAIARANSSDTYILVLVMSPQRLPCCNMGPPIYLIICLDQEIMLHQINHCINLFRLSKLLQRNMETV